MVRRKAAGRSNSRHEGSAIVKTDATRVEPPGRRYAIRYWLEAPVGLDLDPQAEFVDEFRGSIVFYRDGVKRERVGRFRVFHVRLGDAWEVGWSPCDVLGTNGPILARYCGPLFDSKTGDFDEEMSCELNVISNQLLILDCIEILPQHRGRGLGLAVASKLIDLLVPAPMVLVACCPFPVQFFPTYADGPHPDARFTEAMQLDRFTRSAPRAIAKLRRHVGKMGFKRVAKTDVHTLSTSLVRPALNEICDPGLL